MIALLKTIWRWSWLLTLPVSLVFLYWLVSLTSAYNTFQLKFQPSAPFGLHMGGRNQFNYMLRSAAASIGSADRVAGLRTIELAVSSADLSRLNSNLPHSGFTYVPGQMWRSGQLQDIELRYRGDFMPHWAFPKKSWRVKTLSGQAFLGMRRFNLIAPKFTSQLSTHMGYRLAHRLGLLAPISESVQLRVNGKDRGLHILVEQLDAATLERNQRLPGDLYSGDLVGSDAYRGISNMVFDHPGAWEKIVSNPDFDADSRAPLEELCNLVNSYPTANLHARLSRMLDMRSFGRFAAFELLVQYFHTGSHHNWRLYFDPERARFEPVIWDSNAWGGFEILGPEPPVSLDPNITRFHNLLLGNADFLRARKRALQEFFADGEADAFLQELSEAIANTRLAVASDPIVRPPDPRKINLVLDAFPMYVEGIFAVVRKAYLEDESKLSYQRMSDNRFRILLEGRAPIEGLSLQFDGDMPKEPRVYIDYLRQGRLERRDISSAATTTGAEIHLRLPLCTQLMTDPRFEKDVLPVLSQRVLPTGYELIIEGISGVNDLIAMRYDQGSGMRAARETVLTELVPVDRLYRILP